MNEGKDALDELDVLRGWLEVETHVNGSGVKDVSIWRNLGRKLVGLGVHSQPVWIAVWEWPAGPHALMCMILVFVNLCLGV